MDYIGEIRVFAGTYEPVNWVFCNGQSLDISQYDSLYQLIGSTYGGDDATYFNVPDLRSRVPIGAGQGSGLPNYLFAETGGTETNTLTIANMPAHNHSFTIPGILVSSEDGHKTTAAGNYPAVNGQLIYSTITDGQMASEAAILLIGNTGSASPVDNVQPYLAINYIICCYGIFPTT